MKKLLLIPFLFALACGPAPEDTPVPSPKPVPHDTVVDGKKEKPDTPRREPKAVADTVPDGFCHPGTACDTRGNRMLALTVDPSNSTFQIAALKFYSAGDPVAFILCAKDVDRAPVAGVPATVRVKQTARLLAGDGLTLTGADGCAVARGTVTQSDLRVGPGSNIVNGYLGGRLLNTVRILPDSI